jgi:hypothetical protein
LCKSNCRCLVINLSYHACIPFVLESLPHSVTYSPWFATSYSCTSFMLLVSICISACVEMSALQPMMLFKILSQLPFWKMEHTYKKKFPTFSFTTLGDKLIFLSLKKTFGL